MQFYPYPSLKQENDPRARTEAIAADHAAPGVWVATEKVHGSNFSLWISRTGEIRCGRRNALLSEGESFYDFEALQRRLEPALRALAEALASETTADVEGWVVFGELYGGIYDHPDVAAIEGLQSVQYGVHYRPDYGFFAFDLATFGAEGLRFFDCGDGRAHLEAAQIPVLPILFRGSLKEALAQDDAFITGVPEALGLPPRADNICEGIVIRRWAGDPADPTLRPIFKKKNARFTERVRTDALARKRSRLSLSTLSPEAQAVAERLGEYVTEARLHAVLSKELQGAQHNLKRLMGLYTQDLMKDFAADHRAAMGALDKADRKQLNVWLSGLIREGIEQWL
ncbi:MAG: RNA ligase family protein [Bradymonadia bacterium]